MIDYTEFANVTISISLTGVSSGNFGILGFLTNESGIEVPERARAYTSLEGVGNDWATSTEVYKAATAFYAQTPKPRDFVVLTNYDTVQPAILLGGGHDTLAELVTISAGSFDLTVAGVTQTVSFDLSADTSLTEVAATISAALTTATLAATCTHNGTSFVIKSTATGASVTMSFATGTDSAALGLEQHQGVLSQGIDAETKVDSLAEVINKGIDFTALELHKSFRDKTAVDEGNDTISIANWAEAAKKIFLNTTNALSTLSSAITTGTPSLLKAATLRYSLSVFSRNISQYPGASIFGRAASVNFEGIATTITLNLKQMPTVSVEELTESELAVLRSKHCNVVAKIGKTANAFTDSRMANGSWLDTTHGLMWLKNRIETDMFNALYATTTKIPFTQVGINTVKNVLTASLNAAVKNGLSGPGFLPDGTYLSEGYVVLSVPLDQVAAADKSNRIYRGLSFKMVGAGALHQVLVSGEFSE